jgi:hypothetical protein
LPSSGHATEWCEAADGVCVDIKINKTKKKEKKKEF